MEDESRHRKIVKKHRFECGLSLVEKHRWTILGGFAVVVTCGYQARVVSSTCFFCPVRIHFTIPTFMVIMQALFLGSACAFWCCGAIFKTTEFTLTLCELPREEKKGSIACVTYLKLLVFRTNVLTCMCVLMSVCTVISFQCIYRKINKCIESNAHREHMYAYLWPRVTTDLRLKL